METWRKLEKTIRRALGSSLGENLPAEQKLGYLTAAHRADCIIADVQTSLRLSGDNWLDEAESWYKDPEHIEQYGILFDQEVERLGRGLNGYESMAVMRKAHDIITERANST
jgi:hypothetical protein